MSSSGTHCFRKKNGNFHHRTFSGTDWANETYPVIPGFVIVSGPLGLLMPLPGLHCLTASPRFVGVTESYGRKFYSAVTTSHQDLVKKT